MSKTISRRSTLAEFAVAQDEGGEQGPRVERGARVRRRDLGPSALPTGGAPPVRPLRESHGAVRTRGEEDEMEEGDVERRRGIFASLGAFAGERALGRGAVRGDAEREQGKDESDDREY